MFIQHKNVELYVLHVFFYLSSLRLDTKRVEHTSCMHHHLPLQFRTATTSTKPLQKKVMGRSFFLFFFVKEKVKNRKKRIKKRTRTTLLVYRVIPSISSVVVHWASKLAKELGKKGEKNLCETFLLHNTFFYTMCRRFTITLCFSFSLGSGRENKNRADRTKKEWGKVKRKKRTK